MLRSQFGVSGSLTVTPVRSTSPLFVTAMVKVAVPPARDLLRGGRLADLDGRVDHLHSGAGRVGDIRPGGPSDRWRWPHW